MAVDLYKYYPTFVKLKDRLASGIDDADSRETVLAKLVYMLDQMFDDTDAFIQLLLNLNDPDHHLLTDLHYFRGVSNKAVCQLADMDEAILVNPQINKGSKLGYIGDNSRQPHSWA